MMNKGESTFGISSIFDKTYFKQLKMSKILRGALFYKILISNTLQPSEGFKAFGELSLTAIFSERIYISKE